MRTRILAIGLICLFFISGCKKQLPTSSDISEVILPTIKYFTASPTEINLGAVSMLAWFVENATKVEIDQGVGVVASCDYMGVWPAVTTTYVLTAVNNDGEKTKSCTVTVHIPRAKLVLTEVSVSFSVDHGAGVGRFNCSGWIENTGTATAINIDIWVYIRDDEGISLGWGGTFPVFERLEKGAKMRFGFYRESASLLDIVAFADREQTIKYMKLFFETE